MWSWSQSSELIYVFSWSGSPGWESLKTLKLCSKCACMDICVVHVVSGYGFLGGSGVKNPPTNAGDAGDTALIPGTGRSPGEGHGNPLQYSCLEKPVDRGTWRDIVHGVEESWTWLSTYTDGGWEGLGNGLWHWRGSPRLLPRGLNRFSQDPAAHYKSSS